MNNVVGYLVRVNLFTVQNICIMDADRSKQYEEAGDLGKAQLKEIFIEKMLEQVKKNLCVSWEKSQSANLFVDGINLKQDEK